MSTATKTGDKPNGSPEVMLPVLTPVAAPEKDDAEYRHGYEEGVAAALGALTSVPKSLADWQKDVTLWRHRWGPYAGGMPVPPVPAKRAKV